MKKVLIESSGSYDKLTIKEFDTLPQPKEGEVLIAVKAIGVNYADVCVRMGVYESAKKYVGWPITPGFEFSGVVMKLGPNSDSKRKSKYQTESLQIGMEVFGVIRFGAYSTHVCAPVHQVYQVPKRLSMVEAAGFPSAWLTAYYGLVELVHPRKNQTILVHSAGGGVGSCLVQLGKVSQCKVVGVVGNSHKVSLVQKLGADHVIDKSKENLWQKAKQYAPNGYDIVLDANGVSTLNQSYLHLRPGGKLVVYGFHSMLPKTGGRLSLWHLPKLVWDWWWTPTFSPLKMTGDNKSVLAFNLSYMFDEVDMFLEMMDTLLDLVNNGDIQMPKTTTFPFEKVAEAHKSLESGETVGKLVLVVDDSNK